MYEAYSTTPVSNTILAVDSDVSSSSINMIPMIIPTGITNHNNPTSVSSMTVFTLSNIMIIPIYVLSEFLTTNTIIHNN